MLRIESTSSSVKQMVTKMRNPRTALKAPEYRIDFGIVRNAVVSSCSSELRMILRSCSIPCAAGNGTLKPGAASECSLLGPDSQCPFGNDFAPRLVCMHPTSGPYWECRPSVFSKHSERLHHRVAAFACMILHDQIPHEPMTPFTSLSSRPVPCPGAVMIQSLTVPFQSLILPSRIFTTTTLTPSSSI